MPPSANVSHTWSATRLRDGDELVVARRAQPGDGRLHQMSVVVQLVSPFEVAVARPLAGPTEHGVEVAVGLLGRGDHRRQLAEALVGVGRAGAPDLPRHRLHQLVDVGVGEHHAFVVPGDRALGGAAEIVDPPEPLHPAVAVGERGARR